MESRGRHRREFRFYRSTQSHFVQELYQVPNNNPSEFGLPCSELSFSEKGRRFGTGKG